MPCRGQLSTLRKGMEDLVHLHQQIQPFDQSMLLVVFISIEMTSNTLVVTRNASFCLHHCSSHKERTDAFCYSENLFLCDLQSAICKWAVNTNGCGLSNILTF